MFRNAYSGRRVLVTGHTGFKGSWLALWLQELGAEACGLALPMTSPNHFDLLKLDMLSKARPNMKILHPLPRVNEIEYSIDENPHAYYFEQARNGLYARQALLCDSLGITLDDVKNDKTIIK